MTASPIESHLHLITDAVTATLKEAIAMCDGAFRECCVAIEVSLKQLVDERKLYCTGFELTFDPDQKGVTFKATSYATTPPKNFDFEGIWKTIFMLCNPKGAPGMNGFLRVRRATIAFDSYPTVQYEPVQHEQKATLPS